MREVWVGFIIGLACITHGGFIQSPKSSFIPMPDNETAISIDLVLNEVNLTASTLCLWLTTVDLQNTSETSEAFCFKNLAANSGFKIPNITEGVLSIFAVEVPSGKWDAASLKTKALEEDLELEEVRVLIRKRIEKAVTYEWSQYFPWEMVPKGSEVQLAMDDKPSFARIPPVWELQLFIHPAFRIIHIQVERTTTFDQIIQTVLRETGLDLGCISIFFQWEEVQWDKETVEELNLFVSKSELKWKVHETALCLPPARCGLHFRPPKMDNQTHRCQPFEDAFWERYRQSGKYVELI